MPTTGKGAFSPWFKLGFWDDQMQSVFCISCDTISSKASLTHVHPHPTCPPYVSAAGGGLQPADFRQRGDGWQQALCLPAA